MYDDDVVGDDDGASDHDHDDDGDDDDDDDDDGDDSLRKHDDKCDACEKNVYVNAWFDPHHHL